jgi:CheY-like chemotaxis protein
MPRPAISIALAVSLLGVAASLWWAAPARAAAAVPAELETRLSPEQQVERERLRQEAAALQDRYRLRVAIPEAVRPLGVATDPDRPSSEASMSAPASLTNLVWLTPILGLAALMAARRFAPEMTEAVCRRILPWAYASHDAPEISREDLAEQRAFAEFLLTFKAGPPLTQWPSTSSHPPNNAPFATAGAGAVSPARPEPAKELGPEPKKDDFACAIQTVTSVITLLRQFEGTSQQTGGEELLASARDRVSELKAMTSAPELLPAWQLATTLESLLKQLAAQPHKATASALGTIATGLEFLRDLCQPGHELASLAEPAPQFLVVDDDPLSRHAVALALKKAFSHPHLAPGAEAALAMASQQKYDAIFLDVLMPGMDGFDLCSQIHQTPLNGTTPVVFVTTQHDLDARARSVQCGGTDLLGKPFLTFELTLKALTLTLRGRSESCAKPANGTNQGQFSAAPASSPAEEHPSRELGAAVSAGG